MDGVANMVREFSEDYTELKRWKYTVEYYDDGTWIKYMEKDEDSDRWNVKGELNISCMCDNLLFETINKDFQNGEVDKIRR